MNIEDSQAYPTTGLLGSAPKPGPSLDRGSQSAGARGSTIVITYKLDQACLASTASAVSWMSYVCPFVKFEERELGVTNVF